MAKRGWQVTETDIEDDEVAVTFQHGEAEVELNLDESSGASKRLSKNHRAATNRDARNSNASFC